MVLGRPYSQVDMEHALELEQRFEGLGFPAFQRPSFQLGIICIYTDRPDEARPLLLEEPARLETRRKRFVAAWCHGEIGGPRAPGRQLGGGGAGSRAPVSMAAGISAGTAQERAIGHDDPRRSSRHISATSTRPCRRRRQRRRFARRWATRCTAFERSAVLGFAGALTRRFGCGARTPLSRCPRASANGRR